MNPNVAGFYSDIDEELSWDYRGTQEDTMGDSSFQNKRGVEESHEPKADSRWEGLVVFFSL